MHEKSKQNPSGGHRTGFVFYLPELRPFARMGFAGAFGVGFFPGDFFFGGALGGGAVCFPGLGGTARIRHLGPEPIKSSRWAFSSASRTR